MKQIYDFERAVPPVVTEAMLRKRIEARTLRRQALLISIGGSLMQLCLLVLSMVLYRFYPLAAIVTVCYVLLSTAGTGIFWKQRRHLIP